MKKYIFLCGISVFCSNLTFSNPADLDTSFNNGAIDSLFVAYSVNSAQDVAIQSDGKIVTAGYAGDNALIVRFYNDGTLDKTFYNGETDQIPGTVTVNLGNNTAAYAIATQPLDNKIIIAGYVNLPAGDNLFLARYNIDGMLDTSFAETGYIITSFGNAQTQIFDVKLDFYGNIVVAGWTAQDNALAAGLIARYTPDGILDTTFGTNGYSQILFGYFTKLQALAIQANGQIVVTGQALIDNIQTLIVFRLNSNGLLDATFNGGLASTTLPLSEFVTSQGINLAIQPDQKIVVVGSANTLSGFTNQLYTVLRLNADGTLDTTFNAPHGRIISDSGLVANGVVIQDNSQIVTCGVNYTTAYIVVVIRYNNDGSVDSTFNFEPQTNVLSDNTIGNAIALQPNGKIIISGVKVTPYIQPLL